MKMRDFTKVSPTIWHSDKFKSLPSDDARFVYLYLLTSPHQTSAGCFHLPNAYAASDLSWLQSRYEQARDELIAAEMIRFDASTSVVGIAGWFRFNPPQNQKHLIGIRHALERLPSQLIWAEACAELEELQEAATKLKAESTASREGGSQTRGKTWADWKPRPTL